jgi:hypothetical protein
MTLRDLWEHYEDAIQLLRPASPNQPASNSAAPTPSFGGQAPKRKPQAAKPT